MPLCKSLKGLVLKAQFGLKYRLSNFFSTEPKTSLAFSYLMPKGLLLQKNKHTK
jgi:hypothetical protein